MNSDGFEFENVVESLLRGDFSALAPVFDSGGGALGIAIWSALHEPRPRHLEILEVLLEAGARPQPSATGNDPIDALLARFDEHRGGKGPA